MLTNVRPELGGPGPLKVLPLNARARSRPNRHPAIRFRLSACLCRGSRQSPTDRGSASAGPRRGRTGPGSWRGWLQRCASGTATSRRRSCAAMTSLATRSAGCRRIRCAEIAARRLFQPGICLRIRRPVQPEHRPDPRDIDGGGDTRFVLSLRGVGEGHISSVTFRTGSLERRRRGHHRSAQPLCRSADHRPRHGRRRRRADLRRCRRRIRNGDLPDPPQSEPWRRRPPAGPVHRRRRPTGDRRHLYRLRRTGGAAGTAPRHRFSHRPDAPAHRPDGRIQGHGAVPAPDRRALRHARPAGQ